MTSLRCSRGRGPHGRGEGLPDIHHSAAAGLPEGCQTSTLRPSGGGGLPDIHHSAVWRGCQTSIIRPPGGLPDIHHSAAGGVARHPSFGRLRGVARQESQTKVRHPGYVSRARGSQMPNLRWSTARGGMTCGPRSGGWAVKPTSKAAPQPIRSAARTSAKRVQKWTAAVALAMGRPLRSTDNRSFYAVAVPLRFSRQRVETARDEPEGIPLIGCGSASSSSLRRDRQTPRGWMSGNPPRGWMSGSPQKDGCLETHGCLRLAGAGGETTRRREP